MVPAKYWSRQSPDTEKLLEEIRKAGYDVRSIYSGVSKPVLSTPTRLLEGHQQIREHLQGSPG